MYQGKYRQSRADDSQHVQWWLVAGCCGLLVTAAFVALTLWLGLEGPPPRRPPPTDYRYNLLPVPGPPPNLPPAPAPAYPTEPSNNVRTRAKIEKVHKDEEEKRPTHFKLPIPQSPVAHREDDELRTYGGRLDLGEQLMAETAVKESNVKKKSEAVFPSGFDPELFLRRGSFPDQRVREASATGNNAVLRERPETPPFTYIRPEFRPEDRVDSAGTNSYYYPESDAEEPDEPDGSLMKFFGKRVQEARDWLTSAGQNPNSDWLQLLAAVNRSVSQRNLTAVMSKLREMYNSTDVADVPVSSLLYPDARDGNGSSLLSFGLLAVDLFLLHNVQQIAWNEESRLGEEMLDDPEVVALNALFLPPDRLRQLRQKGSRVLKSGGGGQDANRSSLSEALEFVNSMLRAVLNLNKAFKSAGVARDAGPDSVDCIWTLYCRNLDKTARLRGPYGFLAKMNSLGLRLMMGEFPAERAFAQLMAEAATGWSPIDCERLFPRCSVEEAKDVVMNTILGEGPTQ